MSDPMTTPERPTHWIHRRRRALLGALAVLAVVSAVALALFQPWKLWVDDKVDQAAPVGAAPLTTAAPPTVPSVAGATTIPPAPTTLPVTTVPVTTVPASAGTEFVSIDHATEGTLLLLVDAEGQRFVRFEGFATENGPDLKVYLSANPVGGREGAFDDDFVSLGRLAGNVGNQNYLIPDDVELERYSSLVIWCDRFNSAFGAAPLR